MCLALALEFLREFLSAAVRAEAGDSAGIVSREGRALSLRIVDLPLIYRALSLNFQCTSANVVNNF
jgi:hypothetical protein